MEIFTELAKTRGLKAIVFDYLGKETDRIFGALEANSVVGYELCCAAVRLGWIEFLVKNESAVRKASAFQRYGLMELSIKYDRLAALILSGDHDQGSLYLFDPKTKKPLNMNTLLELAARRGLCNAMELLRDAAASNFVAAERAAAESKQEIAAALARAWIQNDQRLAAGVTEGFWVTEVRKKSLRRVDRARYLWLAAENQFEDDTTERLRPLTSM